MHLQFLIFLYTASYAIAEVYNSYDLIKREVFMTPLFYF
jgi:hypothetical protein